MKIYSLEVKFGRIAQFKWKYLEFGVTFFTQLFLVPVKIVPAFELMKNFGWTDSYYAPNFPYFATTTGTFIFRQFFMPVPKAGWCSQSRRLRTYEVSGGYFNSPLLE